tara:strand:+ start:129100 stop:131373 length:2274 start_codon:yes stop_codon:yes gene_type:complete
MFMMAEEALFPQLLTVPLGILTLFFTDRWEKFSLSPLWANILGLLAFLIVCAEFFSNIEGRLLSGAHFLVYLTWIILLQKKSDTQYWWLCALGFLQIAVGAVLTESGFYGSMLVIYMFLSIWTLSVFSLYRTRNTFFQQKSTGGLPRLNVERTAVSPFQQSSQVQGGVQSDQSRRWLTAEFFWATIGCSITALLISMCFFLLIPRLWVNRSLFNNETIQGGNKPLVGFSEKVQLGEMGEILESSERVLELTVYDDETDEPVTITEFVQTFGMDEPLFRGTVLSNYQNGSWSKVQRRRRRRRRDYSDWRPTRSKELDVQNLYRQEFILEPIGTKVLFIMQPILAMDMVSDGDNSLDVETSEIRQKLLPGKDKTTKYNLFTAKNANQNSEMYQLYREDIYLGLPRKDLKRLIRYTKDLIAAHPELKTDREKAKFIETYLRDSGEYSYTLNMSIEDPTIDPVEDFLFNRKSGHCEYYASALALMLRAIGVPTRVITGFKGGEQKYLSNNFEVQQRHAHSWIEAYLNDRWETMDATPALQRAEMVAKNAASFSSWKGANKMLTQFWHDYVIGVSLQRQKRAFYEPITRAGKKLSKQLLNFRTTIAAAVKTVRSFLSSPRRWFSWEGGAAVFIIAGLFFGLKWLSKITIRFLRFLFNKETDQSGAHSSAKIAFYEKFQSLLAKKGLVRSRSETQKEFSDHVKTDLRLELTEAQISEYPDQVTQLYYHVRYGNHALEPRETAEIQQKITTLESVLLKEEQSKG